MISISCLAERYGDMSTKKILILSLVLSLIGHVLLISATGFFEVGHILPKTENAIIVNINEPPATRPPAKKREAPIENAAVAPAEAMAEDVPDEETIDLDSQDTRFIAYLLQIKLKIGYIWSSFPDRKSQGVSKILFSLDNTGTLTASRIVASSGDKTLDREILQVIKAAAPYAPFPKDINLSRLNITATFRYDLAL